MLILDVQCVYYNTDNGVKTRFFKRGVVYEVFHKDLISLNVILVKNHPKIPYT